MTNLIKQKQDEFDEKFKPSPDGRVGVDLIMQQIIEKHNEGIKEFIAKSMREVAEEVFQICEDIAPEIFKGTNEALDKLTIKK